MRHSQRKKRFSVQWLPGFALLKELHGPHVFFSLETQNAQCFRQVRIVDQTAARFVRELVSFARISRLVRINRSEPFLRWSKIRPFLKDAAVDRAGLWGIALLQSDGRFCH